MGATEAAIAGLQSPLVLIAGGQGKGQDFTPLGEALRNKARAVLLIGADAAKIEADLQGFGLSCCIVPRWKKPPAALMKSRKAAILCCSARLVPASICLKVMPIAQKCSPTHFMLCNEVSK